LKEIRKLKTGISKVSDSRERQTLAPN